MKKCIEYIVVLEGLIMLVFLKKKHMRIFCCKNCILENFLRLKYIGNSGYKMGQDVLIIVITPFLSTQYISCSDRLRIGSGKELFTKEE